VLPVVDFLRWVDLDLADPGVISALLRHFPDARHRMET
jgi:hypothetical protein